MHTILYFLFINGFFISISVTEAWKWRKDMGSADDNKLVNYESYHVWRAITNISALGLAFVDISPINIITLLVTPIAAWLAYERVMSYVQFDDFMYKRESFNILGNKMPRPSPYLEVTLMLIAYIISILVIF
jgi:hypothetical protein